jgi:RNA-directed DNA polymerase
MNYPWLRPRSYRHLDVPVGLAFAEQVVNPSFVARHAFGPLLYCEKRTKRYKQKQNRTEFKCRPIMYCSHRDGCIVSYYAHILNNLLEHQYAAQAIGNNVIAYRKLGKGNYHFAAEVLQFARSRAPCSVLCFDVTSFFDSLDHKLLKTRLKSILGVKELSDDWYAVFRYVTRHKHVSLADLKANPVFNGRLMRRAHVPIATVCEIKAAEISITVNANPFGIPQGTPISSSLSNLYMLEFDALMASYADEIGGLYRRYCDDILFVCPTDKAADVERKVADRMLEETLTINPAKTERHQFDPNSSDFPQYLGYRLGYFGVGIREASLARQWRKLRRNIRRTVRVGQAAIAKGHADKIYTKRLRRRFSALPFKNFSSYARRSAQALDSKRIVRQTRRIERELEKLLGRLKAQGLTGWPPTQERSEK